MKASVNITVNLTVLEVPDYVDEPHKQLRHPGFGGFNYYNFVKGRVVGPRRASRVVT